MALNSVFQSSEKTEIIYIASLLWVQHCVLFICLLSLRRFIAKSWPYHTNMADWIFSLQNLILFTALVAHKSVTKISKILTPLQKERKFKKRKRIPWRWTLNKQDREVSLWAASSQDQWCCVEDSEGPAQSQDPWRCQRHLKLVVLLAPRLFQSNMNAQLKIMK